MASAFGHAYAALSIGSGFNDRIRNRKFLFLGMLCSILPDADVISFQLGVPYEAFWGHRGFTHSLLFALLLGIIITLLAGRESATKERISIFFFFTLCTASHGMLDGMTSGGLGVAFFSPFDTERYFLPWRPIKVSPIGAGRFFSEWGLKVLLSEALWIGIPGTFFMLMMKIRRK
jgi:inner membrane protein